MMSIRKATYQVQWMKLDVVSVWIGWIRKLTRGCFRESDLIAAVAD